MVFPKSSSIFIKLNVFDVIENKTHRSIFNLIEDPPYIILRELHDLSTKSVELKVDDVFS